ncbi:hypothetical protein BDP27DRAFT_799369 [Rhodocollybia butyracea]|uniref:Cyclin N-terminal domain-containing protein n=1 Tax=Rhodocollybia butyracea TaxID=206335 RepID=A0A9P5UFM0_9AGAR|nr:hypothetical protein BDP27DRAFT_799369 [Rhodocollybia butyracea]
MPVPVPFPSKQPVHLVIKSHLSDNGVNHSFQDLTGTLPLLPTGPPPSFGTREQWINSLPSWRRSKPRIWEEDDSHSFSGQDFQKGLAVADNAPAIKGPRAEACVPPFAALLQSGDVATTEIEMHTSLEDKALSIATNMDSVSDDENDRGVFTPIFEEESPESRSLHEASSSPIEPLTPFGDFIDRAVSSVPYSAPFECSYVAEDNGYRFHPAQPDLDLQKEPVPAPAPALELVTPTATSGYRKLSEPLSEWIANFVWKACTTGTNVPSFLVRPRLSSSKIYAVCPPGYLSTSIHSLLLSTLLQPSAIFLALWYIVRLPVYFSAVDNIEHAKELRFRIALLGENDGLDRDATENTAPFRLIVLGCMLANKWLDDHTFSNKTWHSISNVPVQTLNKLESLTLEIFGYDLSISASDWSDWLSHMLSYHLSLSSPSHRQPISRPSTNPHLIIRLAMEEIMNAPSACNFDRSHPQPIFLGLDERRKEKQEKAQAQKIDALEIDLDEDGPLREEYVPKRRVSGASSTRISENVSVDQRWEMHKPAVAKTLPPPAKWSPAGDEPILRESNHPYGRYVAVQPTPGLVPVPSYQVHPQYQPAHDFSYAAQTWIPNAPFTAKPLPIAGHFFDFAPLQPPQGPTYHPCPPLIVPFALSQPRSQTYSRDTSQLCNHARSYSQSQFEYRCSDLRMTANELPSLPQGAEMSWGLPGHYVYGAPAFAPHPTATYQSNWLRT